MISTRGQRIGGYAKWFNGDIGAPDIEKDTCQCAHCGGVFYINPFQAAADAGGWCMRCAKVICPHCVGRECVPFELQIARMEGRR